MPDSIQTSYVQQYTTNVELLLQQTGSKLRDLVTVQSGIRGKAAVVVDQFGSTTAVRDLPRHSDTPLLDVPEDRRWVYPHSLDWASLIDDEDKLRTITDPTNPYAMAGAAGMGRSVDDEIIHGLLNSNMTGENGTTATGLLSAYGSGSQLVAATVGASGNTGLNVAKLREAKRILMAAEVDFDREEPIMLISSKQHDNLLAQAEIASKEFNEAPVLVNGVVTRFMGFRFRVTERIPGAAQFNATINPAVTGFTKGTTWLVPFFVKSGVALGVWDDLHSSFDRRPDKRNAMQVLVKGTVGATRTQELKCGLISCY